MKAKTFLKIVKRFCCDKYCDTPMCPVWDKERGCLMLAEDVIPEEWDIKQIIKAVKKHRKLYRQLYVK